MVKKTNSKPFSAEKGSPLLISAPLWCPSPARAKKLAALLNTTWRRFQFQPKSAGKHARTKGHQFEREIAIALRAVFPGAKRHLEYQAGEAQGVDLDGTGDYKIQCKRGKQYAPLTAIEEVQHEAFLGEIPVLITAADNKPTMAVIPFEEFLRLIQSKE